MSDDEQTKFLTEATRKVAEQAFHMKRAMDASDITLSLEHAADMLRELKTSLLTPKNYYELYMKVLDEMRYVEEFFTTLNKQGRPMVELYERVQHCANVVPRLYLLIAVGAVYIKSGEAPAKDILKDLIEMVKCVQFPTRGLFLRNYLSQVSRDKLPDTGSPYEGVGGDVTDAYEFVLQNFSEMNRLWVRLQHMGGAKETRKKREKERQELRILVGTNLVRLSQLEGIDAATYRDVILPRILEQINTCKDTIAQSYLMDCVIQVFPDEFHLATLETFLTTCTQLKEKVNIRSILQNMMNRLSNYSDGQADRIPSDLQAFNLFNDCITKILEERSNLDLAEILRLQTALMTFALKCYPGRLDYVNYCLGMCASVLSATTTTELDEASIVEVEELLSIPLTSLALKVLDLKQYSELLCYLPYENRKQVATILVRSTLFADAPLDSVEKLEKLFVSITPLIKDEEKKGDVAPPSEDDDENSAMFVEEQTLVARTVHLMKCPDTDLQFRLFSMARKAFGQGGVKRIKHTLVPLVFGGLQLAYKVKAREAGLAQAQAKVAKMQAKREKMEKAIAQQKADYEAAVAADPDTPPPPAPPALPEVPEAPAAPAVSCRKVFQFLHEIITAMATTYPELSLNLFLQAAISADKVGFKPIAYEFMSQAFILYEDELKDSKAQLKALITMVGTLLSCANFETDDYDTLSTKITQYSAKLLKKPDQARMVTLCSNLFFVGAADNEKHYHDPKRVLECLQRALKIADGCMASSAHVHLFVEILNHYLYYFERGCPSIQEKYLSGLIQLINEHVDGMDHTDARAEVETTYRNTLTHIAKKKQDPGTAAQYAKIQT